MRKINFNKTGFDNFSQQKIKNGLGDALDSRVFSLKKSKYGRVNLNLEVLTQNEKFFVKIAPVWYKNSLEREKWVIQNIHNVFLHVPEIFKYFDEKNKYIKKHEVLIMKYVDGDVLEEVDNKENYFEQIFKIYNDIHQIKVKGYGWLSEDHMGLNRDWSEYLLNIENSSLLEKKKNTWNKELIWVKNELLKSYDHSFQSKLLYGDFNYSNFIVSPDGKILTALDFQNVFAGDPLYDFGIISSKDNEFMEFILNRFKLLKEKKKIIIYGLRHLLTMLSYYLVKDDCERLSFVSSQYLIMKTRYLSL